jgi:hypothetical protein
VAATKVGIYEDKLLSVLNCQNPSLVSSARKNWGAERPLQTVAFSVSCLATITGRGGAASVVVGGDGTGLTVEANVAAVWEYPLWSGVAEWDSDADDGVRVVLRNLLDHCLTLNGS